MAEHLADLPHIFEIEDRQRARLVELDPKYVDVIVRRWEESCGGSAWLNGLGRHFAASTEEPQAADSKVG